MSGLLAYLPHHLAHALAANPAADPRVLGERVLAVTLFADISGFTPLSEALARNGRRGAEELTTIVNAYFAPMIALLETAGGIVCGFGGDALVAIIPYTPATRRSVTLRAAACAAAMQRAMAVFTTIDSSAGPFALRMKIGLARGPLRTAVVGDPAVRLQGVVLGTAVERCTEAEHHAAPGQVIAAPELRADLGFVEREGFVALDLDRAAPRAAPLAAPPAPTPALLAQAARFTHPVLAARAQRAQADFVAELRQVVVLFARFATLDYDHDAQAAARLQAFCAAAFALVASYDGYVNRVDVGDKGSTLLVLFGAPVGHEDDAARAVRCALDLVTLGARHHLPLGVGVNGGVVFCGHVGAPHRHEYTVMGDAVNLAARLMTAAEPGVVLVGAGAQAACASQFVWHSLPPLQVKGKSKPVTVYRALSAQAAPVVLPNDTVLVGRVAELRRLTRMLTRARAGQGQLVRLVGDAGIGKTRLAAALARRAARQGFVVVQGVCAAYGASYRGWGAVIGTLLGLGALRPATAATVLAERLAALDPRLAERAPLLADVLGVPVPANAFSATLDPKLRAELTAALVVTIIARCANTPLLVILDDAQWLDPLGDVLLAALAPTVERLPLLLLVATRAASQPTTPIRRTLALGELPDADAAALATRHWAQTHGGAPFPPAVQTRVLARAAGNPLFLEALVEVAHDDDGALPDTIGQLIVSRVDQLPAAEQATLKAASVLGARFPTRWLAESYHQLGGHALVAAHMARAAQLNLAVAEPDAEPTYRFRSTLTQESVYSTLAYATRAVLHEQVGGYLETLDDATLLDTLAYHFGHSARRDKQQVYFRRAGDAARARYANAAALDYYARLEGVLDPAAYPPVAHARAEVLRLMGDWSAAEAAAQRAFADASAHSDPATAAAAACTIGAIVLRTAGPRAAVPWLERAYAAQQQTPDAALSRTLEQLSFVHFQLGDPAPALRYAEEQLAVAAQIGDRPGACDARAQIGYIALERGDRAGALATQLAVHAAAEQIGYRRRAVLAASDIAEIHWMHGDLPLALRWLLRAIDEAERIGYRWVLGMMIGNAGLVYARHGDHAAAEACFAHALGLAIDLGNQPGVVQALGWLAELWVAQGHPRADAVIARAIQRAGTLELRYELAELRVLVAERALARGAWAQARDAARAADELAAATDAGEVRERAWRARLRAAVALGRTSIAAAHQQIAARQQTTEDDATRALLAVLAAEIDPQDQGARAAAIAALTAQLAAGDNAEQRRTLARLGGTLPPAPAPLDALPAALLADVPALGPLLARAGVG